MKEWKIWLRNRLTDSKLGVFDWIQFLSLTDSFSNTAPLERMQGSRRFLEIFAIHHPKSFIGFVSKTRISFPIYLAISSIIEYTNKLILKALHSYQCEVRKDKGSYMNVQNEDTKLYRNRYTVKLHWKQVLRLKDCATCHLIRQCSYVTVSYLPALTRIES